MGSFYTQRRSGSKAAEVFKVVGEPCPTAIVYNFATNLPAALNTEESEKRGHGVLEISWNPAFISG